MLIAAGKIKLTHISDKVTLLAAHTNYANMQEEKLLSRIIYKKAEVIRLKSLDLGRF